MTITLNNEELTELVKKEIRDFKLAGSVSIKFQAKKGGEVEAIIEQVNDTTTEPATPTVKEQKEIKMPNENAQDILKKLTDNTPEGVK